MQESTRRSGRITLVAQTDVVQRLRARWQRIDPSTRWAIGLYGVVRVFVSLWGGIAARWQTVPAPFDVDYLIKAGFPWAGTRLADVLIGNWMRWDTGWYLEIAIFGYLPETGNIIFPPLYPLLIRGLGWLMGGHYLLAALLISNVACVVFLVFFCRLLMLDFPQDTARRTLNYLLAFPTGFFMVCGYSEPVFLCFFVLALYAARRGRWAWAGTAAFLSSLARLQGWVLTFPLVYFWVRDRFWPAWRANKFALWSLGSSLMAAGAAGLGTVAFMIYVTLADLPSIEQAFLEKWGLQIGMPWDSLILAIRTLRSGDVLFHDVGNIVVAVMIIVLTLIGLRKLPVFYSLFMMPALLFTLMRYFPRTQLHGTMRYALAFFPDFILLAQWQRRHKWGHRFLMAIFLFFQIVFVAWFVNWIWVS
jgi:hypothetical protein